MKVIIWGHLLHSHTHSYTHEGFYRAFKFLGYETFWFDNDTNINSFDFSDCLFLTEAQVDSKIPMRKDCKYVLHNCYKMRYLIAGIPENNILMLQVYVLPALTLGEKINEYTIYNKKVRGLFQPWATSLLPTEISFENPFSIPKNKEALFIGSYGTGDFGNKEEWDAFGKACQENGIKLKITGGKIDLLQTVSMIKQAYMAPAIQGPWQVEKGYIPCRIFKNISCGQIGITNSTTVNSIYNNNLVYSPNCNTLFFLAQREIQEKNEKKIIENIKITKEFHTFVNRAKTILSMF